MSTCAILTVSDRCSIGTYQDETGKQVTELLQSAGFDCVEHDIVADDPKKIKQKILDYSDRLKTDLILTNGGTGLGFRDNTPEVTREIISKFVPGLPELMRSRGSEKTLKAYLSRSVAGVRGTSLIINLPGSPKGAIESLEAILDILPHAIEMIQDKGHSE